MKKNIEPAVLLDGNSRPFLVFAKGRKKFHAIAASETCIRLVELDTLRGLVELKRKGDPYPARRAASFWLNHDHREITGRAREVLRELVARK